MRDVIFANPAVGTLTAAAPGAATFATKQIAQLKRQLDEMQKSLSALEAVLQPAQSEQRLPQPTDQQPAQQTEKPQP